MHLQRILFILLLINVVACREDPASYPEAAAWTVNPNGDSELALLMRAMYDDGIRAKHQILNGKAPQIKVNHDALFTRNATEPEKIASPEYAAFAESYLASVEVMNRTGRHNAAASYETMINACMACHQTLCPGPRDRIRYMYFSKEQKDKLE